MAGTTTIDRRGTRAEQAWNRALDALEAGQLAQARKEACIAGENGHPVARVRFVLAVTAWYQGRHREAEKIIEMLVQTDAAPPEVYYFIGNSYRLGGNRKAALENYRLVLHRSTDILYRAMTLREIRLMRMLDEKQFARLVALCSKDLDSEDSYTTLSERRGFAILVLLRGDEHDAFLRLRALQREHPRCAEIYRDFALLHTLAGDWRRAALNLRRGRKFYPLDYEMQWELAHACHRSGRLSDAVAVLGAMSGESLDNPALHVNIGNLQMRLGRNVAAIRAFRRAIDVREDYLPALFNLATLYHQAGTLDLAERYYKRVQQIDPTHAWSAYNLALLYYETGDYTTALRMLKRCHDDHPEFPQALRNLRFINLARVCFPNEGPEERKDMAQNAYWIGAASVAVVLVFTFVKGWL